MVKFERAKDAPWKRFRKLWHRMSPAERAEILVEPHWTDGPAKMFEENEAKFPDYDYYGSFGRWGSDGLWYRSRQLQGFHGNFGGDSS